MIAVGVLEDLFSQRSRFRLPLHILLFFSVATLTSFIPYLLESAHSRWQLHNLPNYTFPSGLNSAPLIHCEQEYHGVLKNTSLSYLQVLVAQTKGYSVHDWPLHLGWNNVSRLSINDLVYPIL